MTPEQEAEYRKEFDQLTLDMKRAETFEERAEILQKMLTLFRLKKAIRRSCGSPR
jgi:hypothetical protein